MTILLSDSAGDHRTFGQPTRPLERADLAHCLPAAHRIELAERQPRMWGQSPRVPCRHRVPERPAGRRASRSVRAGAEAVRGHLVVADGQRGRAGSGGWAPRFVLLAAIWGLSFLFIKVGDESLAPLQVAFGRTATGAATLLVVLAARRQRLPGGWRTWGHLAVAAVLLNAAPFSLFAYGEQHVPSVLAGIWNATTPLFALPAAVLMLPGERLGRSRGTGLLIGFVGVLVVLGVWNGFGGGSLQGNALCLSAAACYGVGFPYTRRYLSGRGNPLPLAAGQLLCGTLELAALTPVVTGAPAQLPARVVVSVLALGVFGTGLAYVLNYSIIRDAGATVSSTVTYVIPVFSTLAGLLVLGEPLSWHEPVGAAVVAVGALLAQGRLQLPGESVRLRTGGGLGRARPPAEPRSGTARLPAVPPSGPAPPRAAGLRPDGSPAPSARSAGPPRH